MIGCVHQRRGIGDSAGARPRDNQTVEFHQQRIRLRQEITINVVGEVGACAKRREVDFVAPDGAVFKTANTM